jgi:hypothetical protein
VVETDNGVANKEARSLGSTVLVDACGAVVAVLRNRAEIVRARADGEFPNSAACPFPVGSHSFGRCRHGGVPRSRDGALVLTADVGRFAPARGRRVRR